MTQKKDLTLITPDLFFKEKQNIFQITCRFSDNSYSQQNFIIPEKLIDRFKNKLKQVSK